VRVIHRFATDARFVALLGDLSHQVTVFTVKIRRSGTLQIFNVADRKR
jgi:hypothetical protein